MSLTVGELRALIDGLDDSVEVRLATQPSYPFESAVAGLNVVRPNQDDVECTEGDIAGGELSEDELVEARAHLERLLEVPEVVYFCEGRQLGYASRELWNF